MSESLIQNFNHLKIHSQYSICEGAVKLMIYKIFQNQNKLKSLGLCDTSNLCGALEFAEKISKVGTQPIIGTQINFKYGDCTGLLPLFALNEEGYKRIIKLSSISFLENDELSDPHVDFKDLLDDNTGCCCLFRNYFWIIW
jgi:DNA polymerase-3 subunit alpha